MSLRAELQASLNPGIARLAEKVRRADMRDDLITKMGRNLRAAHKALREGRAKDALCSLDLLDIAQRNFLDHMEITMSLAVADASAQSLADELRRCFAEDPEETREIVLKLASEVCAQAPSPKKKERQR